MQSVDPHKEQAVDGSSIFTRQPKRMGVVGLLFGLLVYSLGSPLAGTIGGVLPVGWQVSSAGTGFGSWSDTGDELVRRVGWLMMAASGAMLLCSLVPGRPREITPRVRRFVILVATSGSAVWYGWLAQPHNGFPANARIHWVDFLTVQSWNFFYAAGRIPHMVFYDVPYVWQALNVAVVVVACYALAHRLGLSPGASAAMAATPALSSNLLLFASTAEDVMLNIALLLFAMWAVLRRGPILVGLTLAFAVLGRPSFLVLVPCLVAGEFVWALRRDRSLVSLWAAITSRYVVVSCAVATTTIAISQIIFEILGRRYFFTNGRIVDTGSISNAAPIEIDGFTISAFSGTYLGHALWVMPVVFLLGVVVAVVRAPNLPEPAERLVYFSAVSAIAILAVHESQPLFYYNVRYLTYIWPFIFVLAWCAFATVNPRTVGRPVTAALVVLLLAGAAVLPVDPLDSKRRTESRVEVELLDLREDLRRLGDAGRIALTFGGRSSRNFVDYVMRSSSWGVGTGVGDVRPGWVIISERVEPWSDRPGDFETKSLVIHIATADELSG